MAKVRSRKDDHLASAQQNAAIRTLFNAVASTHPAEGAAEYEGIPIPQRSSRAEPSKYKSFFVQAEDRERDLRYRKRLQAAMSKDTPISKDNVPVDGATMLKRLEEVRCVVVFLL